MEKTPSEILKDLYPDKLITELTQEEQREAIKQYQLQYLPNLQDLGATKIKLDIDSFITSDFATELINNFYKQTTLESATGDYLNWIGGLYGLSRNPDESDENYKIRINNLKESYPVEEFIITNLLKIEGVKNVRIINSPLVYIQNNVLYIVGLGEIQNFNMNDQIILDGFGFSFSLENEEDVNVLMQIGEVLRQTYPNTPLLQGSKKILLDDQSSVSIYFDEIIDIELKIYEFQTKNEIKLSQTSINSILDYFNKTFPLFIKQTQFSESNIKSCIPSWIPELKNKDYSVYLHNDTNGDMDYPWSLNINELAKFNKVNGGSYEN